MDKNEMFALVSPLLNAEMAEWRWNCYLHLEDIKFDMLHVPTIEAVGLYVADMVFTSFIVYNPPEIDKAHLSPNKSKKC